MKRFEGTDTYIATDDLMMAVNAALTLERPLLVKGEPGTGKTMLAIEIARAIGRPLYEWHIKSTTKAQHGLYEYDAVSRLRDSQLGDARVHDIRNYIVRGMLWSAFVADTPAVLLIDEVDKADIEFPNDLLRELDRMEFYVYETQELVKAKHGLWSSSPATTKRSCRMRSCAAASFTTSVFPTTRPWSASSACTILTSRRISCAKRLTRSSRSARCPG